MIVRECKGVRLLGKAKGCTARGVRGQRDVVPLVICLEVDVRAVGTGFGLAIVLCRGH